MLINLNKSKVFLLFFVPIFFSCVQERCSSCSQGNKYKEQFKICFSGSYLVTKSASVLPAGVETSIFTYYSGEDPCTKKEYPGSPILATSDISGNLQLRNNFVFYLTPGYYDFYATSTNSGTLNGLSFKIGQSNKLKNGCDYLWGIKKDVTICNNSNVQFCFKHLASSIIIEVSSSVYHQEELIKVLLKRAIIALPDTNQILKLASGEITQAKSITSLKADMYIKSNKAYYIILPLEKKIDIPIELHITTASISNQEYQEVHFCTLPSPPNGFRGGMQYNYRAKLIANQVVFENTVVQKWDEKEINNLYLSENK